MRIVKGLLIGLVVLVAIFVVIGFFLPKTAHVERSVTIARPPCTVFALVNSFKLFNQWSPWAAMDPNAKYAYEGPEMGVGAVMKWASDKKEVGSGSQTIVASEPFKLVKTKLDFGPQGVADGFFKIAAGDGGTMLTWGFDTAFGSNIVARYFGLVMDSMVGKDFEKGLAALKKLAESLPETDWSDLDVKTAEVQPVTIAYVAGTTSQDNQAMGKALQAAFQADVRFVRRHKLKMDGAPIAITKAWTKDTYSFEAGVPIAAAPATKLPGRSSVRIGTTYGGRVVQAVHHGPYENLSQTYEKLMTYIAAYGMTENGSSWEEYVTDPSQTPPEQLVTNVYFPIK